MIVISFTFVFYYYYIYLYYTTTILSNFSETFLYFLFFRLLGYLIGIFDLKYFSKIILEVLTNRTDVLSSLSLSNLL